MDTVLLAPECKIPLTEQEGRHSLLNQRTSYSQFLKLQDPFEWWHLSKFSKEELQLGERATEDRGVENSKEVERESRQQEGLLTFNKAHTHEDDIDEARALVARLKCHITQDDLHNGLQLHSYIVQQGLLDTNVFVGCALLNMYAKCGALDKAQELLDELRVQNVVSWNALIAGYTQHGYFADAMSLYDRMQCEGISPNAVTFTCILNACGNLKASDKGLEIHALAVRGGLVENDIVLANAVLDMYAKCGLLAKAQEVLEGLSVRDVVSYTALVVGYAQLGHAKKAFDCFDRMQQEGISPNLVTFVGIVKACGSTRAADLGRKLHAQFVIAGLLEEDISLGTAVVGMYAKCGSLVDAQDVFDELLVHDVVLWNVLIAGYVDNEHSEEALFQFDQMQAEGFPPSTITFACILKACGSLGMKGKGQDIHAQIVKVGHNQLVVGTGLVDMYANCAMLAEGQEVFDNLQDRNIVSWSALMDGYGQQGEDEKVFALLDQMTREGVKEDWVIVTIVLNTCSHGGLLDEAQRYFESLHDGFDVSPTLEHYTCMVDVLGRAGLLDEAMALIEEMHSCANLTLWHTLLGACRKWGYVKLGRWIFELAIQLDQKDAETYACMCNIYV